MKIPRYHAADLRLAAYEQPVVKVSDLMDAIVALKREATRNDYSGGYTLDRLRAALGEGTGEKPDE